ncbi:MAG TPA: bestrophin family ion channel [Isosphaeraceae bacterium]
MRKRDILSREVLIDQPHSFWLEALSFRESATPHVILSVAVFVALALVVSVLDRFVMHVDLGVEIAPYEIVGAAVGVLLIQRVNAGYDRWWEGRKLWGGIDNQTRNCVLAGLSYGPTDPAWRDRFVRWVAAFPHAARRSLRDERTLPELVDLLGEADAARVVAAEHMPGFVALAIGAQLREARDHHDMDRFGFLQADRERATLIDHVGACERIRRSPLPTVLAVNIRRFLFLYLSTLPFALIERVSWPMVPLITLIVAFALLELDQIGIEPQGPFDDKNLGHLPLNALCEMIQGNLLALLKESPGCAAAEARPVLALAEDNGTPPEPDGEGSPVPLVSDRPAR